MYWQTAVVQVDVVDVVSRVLVTMMSLTAVVEWAYGMVMSMLEFEFTVTAAGTPPTVAVVVVAFFAPKLVPHTRITVPPWAVPLSPVVDAGQVAELDPMDVMVGGPAAAANALSTPTTVRPASPSSSATAILMITPTRDTRETDCSIEPTPRVRQIRSRTVTDTPPAQSAGPHLRTARR